jgi:hypothetical protein
MRKLAPVDEILLAQICLLVHIFAKNFTIGKTFMNNQYLFLFAEVFDNIFFTYMLHCNENPIYVFPEMELCGLSPNFHIHVSVSDLYIPRISPHIFMQQNWQIDGGNI